MLIISLLTELGIDDPVVQYNGILNVGQALEFAAF